MAYPVDRDLTRIPARVIRVRPHCPDICGEHIVLVRRPDRVRGETFVIGVNESRRLEEWLDAQGAAYTVKGGLNGAIGITYSASTAEEETRE